MVNVTTRVREVKQPYGGYIPPKSFEITYLTDGALAPVDQKIENVHYSLVGMAVDYLTRWCADVQQAPVTGIAERVFHKAVSGARAIDKQLGTNHGERVAELCRVIDESQGDETGRPFPTSPAIRAAVVLSSFDVAVYQGVQAFDPDVNTTADEITIQHIAKMVERSLTFFQLYGPVLVDGFLMIGGYTETVDRGDGDFITLDTLWDLKVSVKPPTSAHTLQVLMYWLMGHHGNWHWKPLWPDPAPDIPDLVEWGLYEPSIYGGPIPTHIGIYNPRLDVVYRLAVASIPAGTLDAVSRDVIGYV